MRPSSWFICPGGGSPLRVHPTKLGNCGNACKCNKYYIIITGRPARTVGQLIQLEHDPSTCYDRLGDSSLRGYHRCDFSSVRELHGRLLHQNNSFRASRTACRIKLDQNYRFRASRMACCIKLDQIYSFEHQGLRKYTLH
jgi:hypothetical protein